KSSTNSGGYPLPEEKAQAESVLARQGTTPAVVMWMLEDEEHIYLQSNVLWMVGDLFPFKLIGPLQRLLDERIISDQVFAQHQPKEIYFTDDVSMRRLSTHESTRVYATLFKRINITDGLPI